MNMKPWYTIATPREDLRENRPLDASEFAVHLDDVRLKRATAVYSDPEQFFERTYLTKGLTDLAAEVVRRLAGIRVETSPVFNMSTQFGGGKTHALALLYHLAQNGPAANGWQGVHRILAQAGLRDVPRAATATFVGMQFDALRGRGGDDGTPLRKTPWGEIAFQLGGEGSFAVVAEHDREFIEPKGDVIRAMLPPDRPCLILMDEIINHVSSYRHKGYHNRLYNFVQALSETARSMDNVVLVVSIPASELEYTDADAADEQRFKKMLDRLGKSVMMAADAETAEIIRRRLFEWRGLPAEAQPTVEAYTQWIVDHRYSLPQWFPIDHAREILESTYPFHPMAISVFERKWQALPQFQRTRGVLRLLALWVARAYQEGYQGAHRDSLIGLGTAPVDDPSFRVALFEQLGEDRLEAAVTTDIAGRPGAHAMRLDQEAVDTIRKARLHRKVASTIFFESNGGQTLHEATLAEVRLAVSEPDLDIGNVETALNNLSDECYYLETEGTSYRFNHMPNLNKLLADRRATINVPDIRERIRTTIEGTFPSALGLDRVFYPAGSGDISDHAVLMLVVMSPERGMTDQGNTLALAAEMTRNHGASARTYKNALIWAIAEDEGALLSEARELLAWEQIQTEQDVLHLSEQQRSQLSESLRKAKRDLAEAVWRSYRYLALWGKDNDLRTVDMGLVHSSSADSMTQFVLSRLRMDSELVDTISPNYLLRNWPPAFVEWSTKAVRDAFYASPQFPRLSTAEAVRQAIASGISNRLLAYVGKAPDGGYQPFLFGDHVGAGEIEISDDLYIITKERAEEYIKASIEPPRLDQMVLTPTQAQIKPGGSQVFAAQTFDQNGKPIATPLWWGADGGTIDAKGKFTAGSTEGQYTVTAQGGGLSQSAIVIVKEGAVLPPIATTQVSWVGQVPCRQWMTFYTKVLSSYAMIPGLTVTVEFEINEPRGISESKLQEIKGALRELGLDEQIEVK